MASEENAQDNTAKGQTYENATAEMLLHLKQYLGIDTIHDGKPGHIRIKGESGTIFKLDVLAYEEDGRKLIFSCKDTQKRPATEAIGGLCLLCEELAGKGFLVTRKDLSDNMHLVAKAKQIRVLEFDPSEEEGSWTLREQITETLVQYFHHGAELVTIADELKVIVTDSQSE